LIACLAQKGAIMLLSNIAIFAHEDSTVIAIVSSLYKSTANTFAFLLHFRCATNCES